MASYTLFGQTTPTSGGTVYAGSNSNGVEFSVSTACTLDGIWLYSAPSATDLPETIGLYTVSGQTLVVSQTPLWSGAAGSGWVYAVFSSPPSLTANINYMAAVCDTTGQPYLYENLNWWSTGPGSGGTTSGPLSAPGGTGSQGFYGNSPLNYPSSQYVSCNWWIDVQVTPTAEPSLIQVTSGSTSASSVTVTLPSPTTAGNTLVALVGNSAASVNGTPNGITLGGSADHWAQVAIEGNSSDHAIVAGWADANCASGQNSVVITTTGGTGDILFAWVFELSGLTGTMDVSSGGANGFSSTWTSGTTATTTQASEVAFGITCGAANAATGSAGLTGPSSPWVNEAQQSISGAAAHVKGAICGYQILSSVGTVTYSGTASPSNTNDTLVFTLKTAPPVPSSGLIMTSII